MRTLKAGFAIYYNGFSTVLHKESVSVGKMAPLKAYYMARNRILYLRKHVEGSAFWTAISLYYCIALPKNILVNLLKRQFAQALATIKGAFWHVNHRLTI